MSLALTVISLGAGVQSSTMALMAARGDLTPMPDCAIFADTGAEPASVYRHLEWLVGELPFPVHIVSAGNIRDDILAMRTNGRPPFHIANPDGSKGFSRRQCTGDYKIDPIRKKLRELIGLSRGQRAPKDAVVEQWIGISTDEIQRMKEYPHAFVKCRWPLIEVGMSRQGCLKWLAERQYPRPPKSACTFCPFHSNAMWRDMRDNDPRSWDEACAVDAAIRGDGNKFTRGVPYLHASLKPLPDVDLSTPADLGQAEFGFLQECDGMCGV